MGISSKTVFLYKTRCLNPEHVDENPSMAVYDDHVYCFGCRYYARKGQIDDSVFGHPGVSERRDNVRSVALPSCAVLAAWATTLLAHPRALARLQERGISAATLRRMVVGYNGYQYTLPVRNRGTLVNVRFRSDDDLEDKAFSGVPGHNEAALYGVLDGLRVVVVEGEMDVLTVLSHGMNAVTMTNGAGALPTLLDHLGSWRGRLVLCGDQDAPGLYAQYVLAVRALLTHTVPVSVARFAEKDIGDVFRERGSDGVLHVLHSATPVRSANDARHAFAA